MTVPDLFTVCSERVFAPPVEERDWNHFKTLTTLCAALHLTSKGREDYCRRFRGIGLPLHQAAKTNEPIVIYQIARITGQQFLEIGDGKDRTAMHEAAFHGHAAALKALLQVGAEVNAIYPCGSRYYSVLDECLMARLHLNALDEQGMGCAVFLRGQGAESCLLQVGAEANAIYRARFKEVDRRAAAEAQVCADALYKTPCLRPVPSDVLHLVEDYANLPHHRPTDGAVAMQP